MSEASGQSDRPISSASEPDDLLPPGGPYRIIGPFDAASLPHGLRAEHRLKPGAWGLLRLRAGSLDFVWDGEAVGRETLVAPAQMVIPPEAVHHLEGEGPFDLTIEFYRA